MTRKKVMRLAGTAATLLIALILTVSIGVTSASAANMVTMDDYMSGYGGKFYSEYGSMEEASAASWDLNIEVASEGFALLKNDDGMLPFDSATKKLSVFGVRSDNLLYAGSGTGAISAGVVTATLKESLTAAGYATNPSLEYLYSKDNSAVGAEISSFGRSVTDSYALYGDAAIVVIARTGGENADVATKTSEDADPGEHIDGVTKKHYLELTKSEDELLEHVTDNFDKVVVIINSSNAVELKEIKDNDKIKGMFWIGHPGQNGIMAVGKLLSGEVNPSGKLVNFYERDFTSDPVWNNYGDGTQAVDNNGDYSDFVHPTLYRVGAGTKLTNDKGELLKEGDYYGTAPQGNTAGSGYFEVQYEEDVYMGYRFYETMWYEKEQDTAGSGDAWYDNATCYPFGFGLSYTEFDQTIEGIYTDEACGAADELTAFTGNEDAIYVKVKVENKGLVAGKDVVQIYVNAPYYNDGIEKPYVSLVGFGKSKLIQPGKTGYVVVRVNVQDMASFDYSDANKNGEKTYELDPGDYVIKAMKNAHEDYDTATLTLSGTYAANGTNADVVVLDKDDFSGNEVKALFSDKKGEDYFEYNTLDYKRDGTLTMTLVSRMDMKDGSYTQPEAATIEELTRSDEWFLAAKARDLYELSDDAVDTATSGGGYTVQPWVKGINDIPSNWTQAAATAASNTIKLRDMTGISMYDATTASGFTKKWDDFMNQLSLDELLTLVGWGNYSTAAIPSIDKERSTGADGPIQHGKGFAWCSAPVQAATWNVELTYQIGQQIGNEAFFQGYADWYGPAMNTHRSHFLGRTFEYFSADGIHGGYMSAALVKGASSKGLACYIKHFVLNEQELYRKGIGTYTTEQAFRELYLKPFQIALQEGGSTAMMTSFNRIGQIAAPVNYRLIQSLVRDEWGWDGAIVTDMFNINCWPRPMLLRAGNELPLNFGGRSHMRNDASIVGDEYVESWDATARGNKGCIVYGTDTKTVSYTEYYYVRTCAQRVLCFQANTMWNKNGVDQSVFTDNDKLTVAQGKTYELVTDRSGNVTSDTRVSISIDAAKYGTSDLAYSVVSGSLPKGLVLSSDGYISGSPTGEAGKYEFELKLTADRWITQTADYAITVSPAFEYSGAAVASTGATYYGTVDPKGTLAATGFALASGQIPDGIAFNAATGELDGKPTKAGTYSFVLQAVTASGTYDLPVTITVSETVYTVTYNTQGGNTIAAGTVSAGGTAANITPVKNGYIFTGWYTDAACTAAYNFSNGVTANVTLYAGWAAQATDVSGDIDGLEKTISDMQKEIDALKDSGGGCGSVIAGSAIAGALLLIGGAAIILVRKKKADQ